MSFDMLLRALNELEEAFSLCGSKLIIGGGFGIFLWQSEVIENESFRSLISKEAWCEARATADLDLFLETEILADLETIQKLRRELDNLNYKVIEGVEYLHFEKNYSSTQRVEINFLTGPIASDALAEKIQIRKPRARPKGAVQLHAYLTQEAIGLSWGLVPIKKSEFSNLYIPHAVTFLVMKLHAFKDRLEKKEDEKAGHHAVDLYRILCLMEEKVFDETKTLLNESLEEAVVISSKDIVAQCYGKLDHIGFSKIREHPLFRTEFELESMRSVLAELFTE